MQVLFYYKLSETPCGARVLILYRKINKFDTNKTVILNILQKTPDKKKCLDRHRERHRSSQNEIENY